MSYFEFSFESLTLFTGASWCQPSMGQQSRQPPNHWRVWRTPSDASSATKPLPLLPTTVCLTHSEDRQLRRALHDPLPSPSWRDGCSAWQRGSLPASVLLLERPGIPDDVRLLDDPHSPCFPLPPPPHRNPNATKRKSNMRKHEVSKCFSTLTNVSARQVVPVTALVPHGPIAEEKPDRGRRSLCGNPVSCSIRGV